MAKTYTIGDIAKKFGYHASYIRQTIKKLELVPVSEFVQGARSYTLWNDGTVADLRSWFASRQSEPAPGPVPAPIEASTGQNDLYTYTLDDVGNELFKLRKELESLRAEVAALHSIVLDAVTAPKPTAPVFVPSPYAPTTGNPQPWIMPNITCKG